MNCRVALALSLVIIPWHLSFANADSTRNAIQSFFSTEGSTPQFYINRYVIDLQICAGWSNYCDHYTAHTVDHQSEFWDFVFLHQYYINNLRLDKFRSQFRILAKAILENHRPGCSHLSSKRTADCSIVQLAKTLNLRVAVAVRDIPGCEGVVPPTSTYISNIIDCLVPTPPNNRFERSRAEAPSVSQGGSR